MRFPLFPSLIITTALFLAGHVNAAAPDLTAGGVSGVNAADFTVTDANSGPTSGVTIMVTPGGGTTNGIEATISSSQATTGRLFDRLQANP